jgi:hypothetical protein
MFGTVAFFFDLIHARLFISSVGPGVGGQHLAWLSEYHTKTLAF